MATVLVNVKQNFVSYLVKINGKAISSVKNNIEHNIYIYIYIFMKLQLSILINIFSSS
jgi:hypothetical protein